MDNNGWRERLAVNTEQFQMKCIISYGVGFCGDAKRLMRDVADDDIEMRVCHRQANNTLATHLRHSDRNTQQRRLCRLGLKLLCFRSTSQVENAE